VLDSRIDRIASGPREENAAALHKQIEDLEKDLAASTDLIAQIKEQRDDRERALDTCLREKAELVQNCSRLQSALRNAESDLRAAQRMISTFERNQRQDRQDIQGLQKRIESLISEVAVLKAKPSESGAQKAASARRKNN
jgi:chromosome segregation ATPase